jgi:hypothetical protein
VRKAAVLLVALLSMPLVAGLYGALHDQLSFGIAPEYFTRFKYHQFGFEPGWFGGHRPTVAVIGFLATWWVGAFIGLFLGGTALPQPDARSMRRAIMRGMVITLCVAALCALAGLAYGWFFLGGPPQGWFLPANVSDTHAFLAVGSMHNASYGGGVLGLIIALTDMEWRRNKRKAPRSGKQRGLPLAQEAP